MSSGMIIPYTYRHAGMRIRCNTSRVTVTCKSNEIPAKELLYGVAGRNYVQVLDKENRQAMFSERKLLHQKRFL